MTLLARRDYACGELGAKLRERGFEPALIEALVEQLRARRMLDDERYAGHFVEYHSARGQGPVRIRRDLECGSAWPLSSSRRRWQPARLGGAGARRAPPPLRSQGAQKLGARRGARPDFCNTVAFPTIISALPSGPISSWIHEREANRLT